jgi:hypothetical protein
LDAQTKALLADYTEDYFALMERSAWDDLARRQRGRLVSLAFGAAGVAYAHWYAARIRDEERLLAGAERWLRAALRRQRSALAFHGLRGGPRAELAPGALIYGRAGLCFLRALVAQARADRRGRARALAGFVDCCRRTPADSWDLYAGAAGSLVGVSVLLRELGDRRLPDLGRDLAARLATCLAAASTPSDRPDRLGLAHGVGGVFYALLAWTAASGAEPPAGFRPALEEYLATALRAPEEFCPRPTFMASLCNGFAGLAVLAVRAHEVLGGAALRAAARGAAGLALRSVPPRPDLCCGRVGVAFACLAAARVDPAGPWRRRARELALSVLLCERGDWEVSGLYGGEAALACLAVDLLAGIDGGPPCLEPPVRPRGRA